MTNQQPEDMSIEDTIRWILRAVANSNYEGYQGDPEPIMETGEAYWAIESLIAERERLARIDTARHIQETMVSPASGYCDEISPTAIPDYIAGLQSTKDKTHD